MNFQKTSKLWFDPEGNEPIGKNPITFLIVLRCSGKNNKVDAVDEKKTPIFLTKINMKRGCSEEVEYHIQELLFYFSLQTVFPE